MQRPCGNRLQKLQRLVHSPPLPQPLSTPAGAERGAQQPYSANALSGVAFTRNGQHSNSPGTTLAWDSNDAACVRFEGWRLTVNSTTSNTRPHRAVELPFPARRGGRGVGGESGGFSARIATPLIAACAGAARAGGPKTIQTQFKLNSASSPPPVVSRCAASFSGTCCPAGWALRARRHTGWHLRWRRRLGSVGR